MSRSLLRPTRAELAVTAASALLFLLAFPPFTLVGPAFVCLVPFAIAVAGGVERGDSAWTGIRLGLWFGTFAYGASIYWIASALQIYTNLAFLGYAGALFVLAVVVAATGGALHAARRVTRWPMAVLLPLVWVASEMALNHLSDLAFPWLPLGLSVAHLPLMAQVADISGVHGVSLWIAATNGLVADMWLSRQGRRGVAWRGALIAAMAAIVAAYGAWRMRTVPLHPLARVAIVQPNVPQDEKWQDTNQGRIVGMLGSGTHAVLAQDDPQLVVWPETALPDFLFRHPDWVDSLRAYAISGRATVLTGIIDLKRIGENDYDIFNAAMVMDPDGFVHQPIYHKGKLVPIVERVPFLNPHWFASWGKYFGSFGRGGEPVIYRTAFGTFGVLICYESIFPEVSRTYRRLGADMIVNITNDAWFGHSLAPYQHWAHLALRAIENRVPVVRSANTGISGWIDPLGRVQAQTPIFEQEAKEYAVQTSDVTTPYDVIGDVAGLFSVAATVALLLLDWRRRRADVVVA
ncbi:MAG TPA: apolipoprotein N-acyltransferase [Gemmatimonadaceae bacterium]|nr:apolipoprotein N-acyltransferase [Gemmatimonadaceae bacterium]